MKCNRTIEYTCSEQKDDRFITGRSQHNFAVLSLENLWEFGYIRRSPIICEIILLFFFLKTIKYKTNPKHGSTNIIIIN